MDVLLVGFIVGLVATGWRTGFLRRLIGLGFLALSFVLGAYLRYPIGAVATAFFKGIPPEYANLVGYTIAFPAILAAAHLITRPVVAHVAVGGLSRRADQALGAVFGGIEAVLIISAAVVILDTYFGTKSTLGQTPGLTYLSQLHAALNGSETVHLLRDSTVPVVLAVLGPLLPKDVSTLAPSGIPKGLPTGFPIPSS